MNSTIYFTIYLFSWHIFACIGHCEAQSLLGLHIFRKIKMIKRFFPHNHNNKNIYYGMQSTRNISIWLPWACVCLFCCDIASQMTGQLDVTLFLCVSTVSASPTAVITVYICYVIFSLMRKKSHFKWQDISDTKGQPKEGTAESCGLLPLAHRHCYYIAARATSRAVRSIFPLWIECNLSSAL